MTSINNDLTKRFWESQREENADMGIWDNAPAKAFA